VLGAPVGDAAALGEKRFHSNTVSIGSEESLRDQVADDMRAMTQIERTATPAEVLEVETSYIHSIANLDPEGGETPMKNSALQ
jgi:hypothetical protein